MDLNKIDYVIAVADLKSISKAASACFVSQPALTRYIQGLERELGLKLFDRSTVPVQMTEAGVRYVEKLRETFDPIVDSLGDFLCFRNAAVTKKNYDGSIYTLCTLRCSYDKGGAVFTILFNEENKIDGVYVR